MPDYLAYLILAVAYLGLVLPLVGSTGQGNVTYKESWMIGLTIHVIVLGAGLVIGLILLAIYTLIGDI